MLNRLSLPENIIVLSIPPIIAHLYWIQNNANGNKSNNIPLNPVVRGLYNFGLTSTDFLTRIKLLTSIDHLINQYAHFHQLPQLSILNATSENLESLSKYVDSNKKTSSTNLTRLLATIKILVRLRVLTLEKNPLIYLWLFLQKMVTQIKSFSEKINEIIDVQEDLIGVGLGLLALELIYSAKIKSNYTKLTHCGSKLIKNATVLYRETGMSVGTLLFYASYISASEKTESQNDIKAQTPQY